MGVLFFLLVLFNDAVNCKITHYRCEVTERVWSINGMILPGENRSTHRDTCLSAVLYTTHSIWNGIDVEVSSQFHAPDTLPLKSKLPLSFVQKAGWALELVCTLWKRKISFPCLESKHDSSVSSP
jgi:hypothetical protein